MPHKKLAAALCTQISGAQDAISTQLSRINALSIPLDDLDMHTLTSSQLSEVKTLTTLVEGGIRHLIQFGEEQLNLPHFEKAWGGLLKAEVKAQLASPKYLTLTPEQKSKYVDWGFREVAVHARPLEVKITTGTSGFTRDQFAIDLFTDTLDKARAMEELPLKWAVLSSLFMLREGITSINVVFGTIKANHVEKNPKNNLLSLFNSLTTLQKYLQLAQLEVNKYVKVLQLFDSVMDHIDSLSAMKEMLLKLEENSEGAEEEKERKAANPIIDRAIVTLCRFKAAEMPFEQFYTALLANMKESIVLLSPSNPLTLILSSFHQKLEASSELLLNQGAEKKEDKASAAATASAFSAPTTATAAAVTVPAEAEAKPPLEIKVGGAPLLAGLFTQRGAGASSSSSSPALAIAQPPSPK